MNSVSSVFRAAVLAAVFSGAAFAQSGHGTPPQTTTKQSGPTLEETQQWLTGKVAKYGDFEVRDIVRNQTNKQKQALAFKGCSFDLEFLVTCFRPGGGEWLSCEPSRATGDLADLDPTQISTGQMEDNFYVIIRTTGQKKTIFTKFGDGSGGTNNALSIDVTEEDIAARMKKAFQHAISICQERAREEQAKHPQPPEPF